jgi:hypothetical protein
MVRQLNCTWSPAEITVGEAFSTAVGAGDVEGGGAVSSASGGCFFLQPGNVVKASSSAKETKTDFRSFNGMLLMGFELLSGRTGSRYGHPVIVKMIDDLRSARVRAGYLP